ncbi:MAG: DUF342 domain-containing protein [Acetanaerobacterium sp.]
MTEQNERNQQNIAKAEPLDAQYRVEVSEDHLRAYITVLAPENKGAEVAIPTLVQALKDVGVVYGLKEPEIKRLVFGRLYEHKMLVAEGVPAQNGKDGEITNRFVYGSRGVPKINVDGSVEYKELNLIYNVTKGQVLCDIIAPTDGTKGITVKGQDIVPARGRDAKLPLGKNVLLSQDGTQIYADINGNLIQRGGMLEINDTFTVNGDVDNSIGNINFIGNVVVKGDVKSGFSITAGGSIRINGIMEAAVLKAPEDITLTGANGQGGGRVFTGGDLKASFLENVAIEAKGSVTANSIMYCNIKCGGTLELKGRNASIVGGIYVVALDVIAKSIGSPSHARSEFTLGASTSLVEEMNTMGHRLRQIESDSFKLAQAIQFLNAKNKESLSKDKLKILDQAVYNRSALEMEKEKLSKRYKAMEEELEMPNTSRIICRGTIYTGTHITMGSHSVQLTEDKDYVMVYYSDNDIVFGAA